MNPSTTPRSLTIGSLPLIRFALLAMTMILLGACSGNGSSLGGGSSGPAPGGPLPSVCIDDPTLPECLIPAAAIYMSVSPQEIKSDGSDAATVTATVVDANNAVIEGVTVYFSTTGGVMSDSMAVSDQNGEAIIQLKANPGDPSNQVVTVTGTVAGVGAASVPVIITGTTLEIVYANTSLQIQPGNTTVSEPLTVIARDAGGKVIYNALLDMSVTGTSGGTLSTTQAYTDTYGTVQTTLTASLTGTAQFTVTGLGTSATALFDVSNVVLDNPFRIIDPDLSLPSSNPYPLTADGVSSVTITVAALGVTNVTFATTIGTWGNGSNIITVPVAADQAVATLTSEAGKFGSATVVVSDAADPAVHDSMIVAMTPDVATLVPGTGAQIILSSTVSSIPPSFPGGTQYSTDVVALVVTDDASGNYPVYNIPVAFSMSYVTGGGEYLATSYGTTGVDGKLLNKFFSGARATGVDGVQITATIPSLGISDSIRIAINGTAGSVVIGTPRFIIEDPDNMAQNMYQMSVQVADGTGAAVPGVTVNLKVWPVRHYSGVWCNAVVGGDAWFAFRTASYTNEDVDRDLILDPFSSILGGLSEDTDMDQQLTPANSWGGTVPYSVTTNALGMGPFDYAWLKDAGPWIDVEMSATTKVLGTEFTGKREVGLGYLIEETTTGVLAGVESPFPMTVQVRYDGVNTYPVVGLYEPVASVLAGTATPINMPIVYGKGANLYASGSVFIGNQVYAPATAFEPSTLTYSNLMVPPGALPPGFDPTKDTLYTYVTSYGLVDNAGAIGDSIADSPITCSYPVRVIVRQ